MHLLTLGISIQEHRVDITLTGCFWILNHAEAFASITPVVEVVIDTLEVGLAVAVVAELILVVGDCDTDLVVVDVVLLVAVTVVVDVAARRESCLAVVHETG